MYKKFGLQNLGIADSTWGGEEWHEMVTLAEENKDSLFYDAWRVWFRYFVSMGYAGWNELWEAV